MAQTLVLFGPPGSGKGTQAARLRDDLGFRQLATGDLLREARAAGTELGQRAAEYMDRGDLVPDDVIVAMVREAIVPDDVVVERILGRGQGRSDDNPETVRERLRVYHGETAPLVGYYDERGLLRRVDGAGDPDAVYEQVRRSAEHGRRRDPRLALNARDQHRD